MSPYVRTKLLFWAVIAVLVLLSYLEFVNFWWIILIAVGYIIFLSYAAFHIELNFFLKSVNSGQGNKKTIAITFDDGPHPEHTPEVLEVLNKYGVKATFFCVGLDCEKHPELIEQIHKAGHLIACHSYTHRKWIDFNRVANWREEIQAGQRVVQSIIGKKPRFFRPPYGVTTPHLAKAIQRDQVVSIGWNIRSLDTMNNKISEIIARCVKGLQPGAILLLHDNLKWSAEVLDKFLEELGKRDYKVDRLDTVINEEPYE